MNDAIRGDLEDHEIVLVTDVVIAARIDGDIQPAFPTNRRIPGWAAVAGKKPVRARKGSDYPLTIGWGKKNNSKKSKSYCAVHSL